MEKLTQLRMEGLVGWHQFNLTHLWTFAGWIRVMWTMNMHSFISMLRNTNSIEETSKFVFPAYYRLWWDHQNSLLAFWITVTWELLQNMISINKKQQITTNWQQFMYYSCELRQNWTVSNSNFQNYEVNVVIHIMEIVD